jgi:hypothetical protein
MATVGVAGDAALQGELRMPISVGLFSGQGALTRSLRFAINRAHAVGNAAPRFRRPFFVEDLIFLADVRVIVHEEFLGVSMIT